MSNPPVVFVLDPSHTGPTFIVPPMKEMTKNLPQPRQPKKEVHFEVKTDLRLSRESSGEINKMAGYSGRSKSETLREIIEIGMKSIGKDPGYRRYVRNTQKMQRDATQQAE